MALLRIFFLLSATWGVHTTMTPPQPPSSPEERLKPSGLEVVIPRLPIILKASIWVVALFETAVILASSYPSHPTSTKILAILGDEAAGSASQIRITLPFLFGWLLNVIGTLIRRHCYRVMGTLFTFELSIRRGHKLITSGPYSYVRHPSYSGGILVLLGISICHLSPGSWLRECTSVIPHSSFKLVSVLLVLVTGVSMATGMRVAKEEAMLKKEFGKQWEQWAADVPYKLLPGVY